MLSIQRLDSCWRQACSNHTGCHPTSLYCETNTFGNNAFLPIVCSTNGDAKPDPTFGIFLPALRNVSSSKSFFEKLFYCFWWGLQNLRFAHKKLASSFLFFNVHLFIGSSIAVLLVRTWLQALIHWRICLRFLSQHQAWFYLHYLLVMCRYIQSFFFVIDGIFLSFMCCWIKCQLISYWKKVNLCEVNVSLNVKRWMIGHPPCSK